MSVRRSADVEIRVGAAEISRDVDVVTPIDGYGLTVIMIRTSHGLRIPVAAVGVYLCQKYVFLSGGGMVVRPGAWIEIHRLPEISRDVNISATVYGNGLAQIVSRPSHGFCK